ncbi:MAG: hypothetical protein Kow00105_16770 [Phycisphaeraceae bacterium]
MSRNLIPEQTRLDPPVLEALIQAHQHDKAPRLRRLWDYYRNPAIGTGPDGRPKLAQQCGLPSRLTQSEEGDWAGREPGREIVIENDIAWRINTIVSFTFGKPPAIQSTAKDPARAKKIQSFLRQVIQHNGGPRFYQDLGLLGTVYGYVDVLVRISDSSATDVEGAKRIHLDTMEAPRVIPILNPDDYRCLDAYVLHIRRRNLPVEQNRFFSKVRNRVLGGAGRGSGEVVEFTHVWTPRSFRSYVGSPGILGGGRRLVDECVNRLGRIPVVHIQNLSQPFFYEGLSEVEPLIPLQDELNTRLSDRANRVTFQSFKMYLGKGIERFTERPVGPGQMWATDNPDAEIIEFGGDGQSPSEDAHIFEIREALDKTSTVSPLAAGLLRSKVGNLTSENALRIVMLGLLATVDKKRLTYGAGIEQVCEMILHAADVHGIFPNLPEERGVRLDWPEPLPDTDSQLLRNALMKIEVGVPRQQVLTELGYFDHDPTPETAQA